MADSRFFHNAGPFSLKQIVELTGAEVAGNVKGDMTFSDVAPLDRAAGSEISFLDNVKYIDALKTSKAGVCFIHPKYAKRAPENMLLLLSNEPYLSYAVTAQKFYPAVHATATKSPVAVSAKISKNVTLEPGCFIGEKVEIGEGCHISAGAVIEKGVIIGAGSSIGANAVLSHCLIGENVIIHRNVSIGQDGFGFAISSKGHVKVPQLGRVIVESNVEIGAGTCIDRGAGPDTVIGEGTKIDNLVQIGHNVTIGRHCIIVSQVGISGSTHIGNGVMVGGQAGITGHLKIGNGARIAAQSGVMTDIPDGASYGGSPAIAIKDWHRQTVAVAGLVKRKGAGDE